MVLGELDDMDESSFSRNLLYLVDTQTMSMAFQLDVQIIIRDVTAKLKSKVSLHSLGGKFKALCMQWKVMVKIDEQVLQMISKKTGSSGSGRKK